MESKFLKQTTALILLTSSILSFSTVAYGETNLQQTIDEVKLEMKRAPLYYVDPALDGVIQPSSTLYSVLNSIKSNYQDVRKDIQKSKLSEREKKLKMKELDALYDEKINKGIVPYIDAYNYGVKYLDPLLKDIIVAQEKNDLQAVEQAYHKLSIQLKSRTSILYRFTGKAPRDLLLAKYKIPANDKRNELIIPVTIYMKVVEAEKLFKSGKKEEAQKILDNIQTLVATLNNQASNEFTKTLLKETERVELVVQVPTVPTPTPVPPTNGGSESSGETSSERALRIAKTNAISALTNYKTASDYSAANWIKILDLKSVGNGAINSAATTTKVTQVLTDAKSNIDLVATKVQEETAQSVIDLINSASTQQQIEEARNAYIQLSSIVKSLVMNENDLQVKEQNLVNYIASSTKVTTKYESAHIGNLVELDSVPVGFTVTFESSGDESIISNSEGKIVSTGTVNIVFNINHTLSGKSQVTSPISITITSSDTTSLITGINEANNLHSNAVEGTEVGEYVPGSKNTFKVAIDEAEVVLNAAATKTTQQLAAAKAALDQAVAEFENRKVVALTGLEDVTITGTANDTSNTVSLGEGETLILNSSDTSIAAVLEQPSGTIKVTGVTAGAPVLITVQVKKDGQVTKTGTFTVNVLSESIISKSLSNLDFSTLYATQAKLVSKPVTIGDFTGNRKEFTIVIGQERIPIYIDWKLSTDFPKGASMGSVVESHIQDYFYKKYGINGFSIRTIAAFGSSDTFQISTFQTGTSSSFTLEGSNWNDFFEQSVAQGTDEDKSKNRTFTISDGTNIATIQLTTKFSTIDTLINQMNTRLKNANVKVQAEKVNESQFKLTLTSSTGELLIDGAHKADFFE